MYDQQLLNKILDDSALSTFDINSLFKGLTNNLSTQKSFNCQIVTVFSKQKVKQTCFSVKAWLIFGQFMLHFLR